MRLDLSSQITLERVPKKYYKPDNDFEEYNLARYEKLPVAIFEESNRAAKKIARDIVKELQKNEKSGKPFVLGISGGASPVPVYEELVRMHKEDGVSFKNLTVFNTYEFYPCLEFSYFNLKMLKDIFLDKIDIDPDNIFSPDATVEKDLISEICEEYEKNLKDKGGMDYLLLGLGSKGNIGFNMPGSSLHSQTRLVMLDGDSRVDIVRNFESLDKVPVSAITMGLYDLMEAKKITLLAWGEQKADSIKDIVEGTVTDLVPGSVLQTHPETTVYVDLAAASELTRLSRPWLVTNCEWDSKLIRRAIVWLCGVVNKPILKLTNEDYNKNPDYYNELSAVKNDKVYGQLPYVSYYNNIETAMADIYFLGKTLYPNEFKDIDVIEKADEIYTFMLGKPLYNIMAEKYGGYIKINLKYKLD